MSVESFRVIINIKHLTRMNCEILTVLTNFTYKMIVQIFCTYLFIGIGSILCIMRDFSNCHDDYNLKPADGVLKVHTFTWLGFAQYIHITTGLPHHSKAPRVVLIHKQFAIGTATDLLHLPKNYKLGNVVFGDYERDEEECGLTRGQAKMGVKCGRAYIEMPLVGITPHPEFSRYCPARVMDYMVPVCLPSIDERTRQRKLKTVYMIDYISTVPRDFDSERMGKKTLKLYTHKECKRHRLRTRLGSEGVTHVLCSSGCGVRSGAPVVSHSAAGTFEIIGIAASASTCSHRSMRRRLNREPPLYIDVYPYITWLINVITAHMIPKPYPHNFMLADGGQRMYVNSGYLRQHKKQKSAWRARTYVNGNYCFKTPRKLAENTKIFYSETFEVNADPPAKLNIFLMVSAGIECKIMCAKVAMPNRLVTPKIDGVGRYNISLYFTTDWFPYSFYFSLTIHGRNSTDREKNEWYDERSEGFW